MHSLVRSIAIESIGDSHDVKDVYNIRVPDYHTYFVGHSDWGFSAWAHNADYLVIEVDIPGVGKRYRLARADGSTDPLPSDFAKLEGKSLEELLAQYNRESAKGNVAPVVPKPPRVSAKLEKVGLTDEITLKFPADQVGEGFRAMSFSVKGGKLRRTLTDGTLASFKGQTVDFVITMDGNLVIGRGHSVISNGKSVRFAGEIKTNRNGEIVQITNRSGHYKPESGQGITQKAKDFLGNEGLDVSKALIVEVAP